MMLSWPENDISIRGDPGKTGRLLLNGPFRKNSNISRTLAGNKIVDNSDVVGASPVGAAPITSSFST